MNRAARIGGFLGATGMTAALVGAAVAGTGAYFTDAEAGTVTGTMGSIEIDATYTTIAFENMLPGEPQEHVVQYRNTGMNNQDVWVVFDQDDLGDFDSATDEGKVNDFGRYAEIHLYSFGAPRFESANLNDDAGTCPPGAGDPACNPLPKQVLLASNLAPGATGDMTFNLRPGAAFKSQALYGVDWFNLDYQIVATQHGIAPDDPLNAPLP